jgi:Holliday junction resolvase
MLAIQQGMSIEDEFAAKVAWLGNAAGINRIDQTPLPVVDIDGRMRAPDFIAFPLVNGQPYLVLIEVKYEHTDHLTWADSYLSSLRRFADRLHLPLLIAWKCGGLWTLVDHRHFQRSVTGYKLTLSTALVEDLSCALFRDLRVMMNPEIELAINLELVDEIEVREDELLPEGQYTFQMRGGGFFLNGKQISNYDPYHFAPFFGHPRYHRISAYRCADMAAYNSARGRTRIQSLKCFRRTTVPNVWE